MRKLIPLIALLPCCISPVAAQVTVDLNALDLLPASKVAKPQPRPAPVKPRVKLSLPATAGTARAPSVTEAPAPSPISATPAPVVASLTQSPASSEPPPSPPVERTPLANLRLPFQAAQADLGGDGAATIKGLVDSAPAAEPISYTVLAYAGATPGDPSAARRLSLSRAMAVRTALMNNGVASTRIFVRALGSQAGDAGADRVDITLARTAGPGIKP